MNYLAHAVLSGFKEELLIGNFIADHVRGNHYTHYPEGIIKGIYLHRQIDSFTDAHPAFKKCKRFFYDGYERYSGVLVDIYFDYLLTQHYQEWQAIELRPFCDFAYSVYTRNEKVLPRSSRNFLNYVLENDIYFNYGQIEGVEKVLFHLSHRLKHGILLNESLHLFSENKEEMRFQFDVFWKDIKAFLSDKL